MTIPTEMIEHLKERFPLGRFIALPSDNPTEVVCELNRDEMMRWGLAVVMIGLSRPHYHRKTLEVYTVVRGTLDLYLRKNNTIVIESLSCGRPFMVEPDTIHWAECVGIPSKVLVTSHPAWNEKDHFLVDP